MIQRIQSIFMALAALCSFGLFGTDTAETAAPVAAAGSVFNDAHLTLFDSPLLIGGAVGAGLVTLIAIFLFGNRKLQAILCRVAIFLTLAYSAYMIALAYNDPAQSQATPELGIALPVLATIFSALAIGYITKDEKLVRSADRLR